MIKRAIITALALVSMCIYSAAHAQSQITQGVQRKFQFGSCIHLALGRSNAETVTDTLVEGGMDSIRDDFYWSRVERKRGKFAIPSSMSELEKALRAVRASGGRPLLILSFGNKLYDNGGLPLSDEAGAGFERYARFVANHFKGIVDQYEVWNEWSAGFGSNPRQQHGDAGAYVRLLKRVYAAIKSEQPNATVVGGAVAGIDFRWIGEFFDAGGLDYLDTFSVHSYTLFRFRDNPEGAIRGLDELRKRMKIARPKREIPVFITEMGWPTSRGRYGISETKAADYLVRFMLLARSRPWIGGVWWYDLIDDGDNAKGMEHRFGLVRRDGSPKPAYAAAKRIAPWLQHGSEVSAYRLSGGGYAVTCRYSGRNWLTMWRVEPQAALWSEGLVDAAAASAEFEALARDLPATGEPAFWLHDGDGWTRVISGVG